MGGTDRQTEALNRIVDEGVEANEEWSLFCPNEAPGLDRCYGKEFDELYTRYEREGKARRSVSAQKLWFAILDAQIETGMPYMLYKGKTKCSVCAISGVC